MQKEVIIVSSYLTLSYILSRNADQIVHRLFSKFWDRYIFVFVSVTQK